MTARIIGNLDMTDTRQILLQNTRQLTFHSLGMVNVVLQISIRMRHLVENAEHLGRRIQEKPRHVARIERLDQQTDIFCRQRLGGKTQVLDHHPTLLGHRHIRPGLSDQTVDLFDAQPLRILNGSIHARAELGLTRRITGNATLAACKITRRQIDEHQIQPI